MAENGGHRKLHISNHNIYMGADRYPQTDDGNNDVQPEPPRVATWRSNLAGFSRRYNLYFFVSASMLHITRPQGARTYIPTVPNMIITLPESPECHDVEPAISQFRPHCVNNIKIGDLGHLEIIVLACDDGDAIAYYTHDIENLIKRGKAAGVDSIRLPMMKDAYNLQTCLHQNVGSSAWGLAIHKKSRLIAISSNLHEVTVFAPACHTNDSLSVENNMTMLDRIMWMEPNECIIHLSNQHGNQIPAARERSCNLKVILPLGDEGSNIPAIDFVDDIDGEALGVLAIDIKGNMWYLGIKVRERHYWECTAFPNFPAKEDPPNQFNLMLEEDAKRGWGVLCLPPSMFMPVTSPLQALGVESIRDAIKFRHDLPPEELAVKSIPRQYFDISDSEDRDRRPWSARYLTKTGSVEYLPSPKLEPVLPLDPTETQWLMVKASIDSVLDFWGGLTESNDPYCRGVTYRPRNSRFLPDKYWESTIAQILVAIKDEGNDHEDWAFLGLLGPWLVLMKERSRSEMFKWSEKSALRYLLLTCPIQERVHFEDWVFVTTKANLFLGVLLRLLESQDKELTRFMLRIAKPNPTSVDYAQAVLWFNTNQKMALQGTNESATPPEDPLSENLLPREIPQKEVPPSFLLPTGAAICCGETDITVLRIHATNFELHPPVPSYSPSTVCCDILDPFVWNQRVLDYNRMNMYALIPELQLVAIASQSGRVALITPTLIKFEDVLEFEEEYKAKREKHEEEQEALRVLNFNEWIVQSEAEDENNENMFDEEEERFADGVPITTMRIEAILPFDDDLENLESQPPAGLLGMAVGPVPGVEGRKRWRIVLHYHDHTIITYEISRQDDDELNVF